jgi:hypothetical protein
LAVVSFFCSYILAFYLISWDIAIISLFYLIIL